jgi:hypothetical protein
MTKKSLKHIITETVLNQADHQITFDEAMQKWWMTMRQDTGLRLTDMGDLSFRFADIAFYDYDFDIRLDDGWHNFILDMNKKIKCPYYVGLNKTKDVKQPYIRLYDSKIAVMVSLYGNINDYLKSVKVRK